MNVQEACDYAVEKIVAQGDRSTNGNGCCLYKSEVGCCAVGWLLEDPSASFKGTVKELIADGSCKIPDVVLDNVKVMRELQGFHDSTTRYSLEIHLAELNKLGINTDHPQWQDWVDLKKTQ